MNNSSRTSRAGKCTITICSIRMLLRVRVWPFLTDPYAVISFSTQSQVTQCLKKTLSPMWDQTLIFDELLMYGDPELIAQYPPEVMIEVFDKDMIVRPDLETTLGEVWQLCIVLSDQLSISFLQGQRWVLGACKLQTDGEDINERSEAMCSPMASVDQPEGGCRRAPCLIWAVPREWKFSPVFSTNLQVHLDNFLHETFPLASIYTADNNHCTELYCSLFSPTLDTIFVIR